MIRDALLFRNVQNSCFSAQCRDACTICFCSLNVVTVPKTFPSSISDLKLSAEPSISYYFLPLLELKFRGLRCKHTLREMISSEGMSNILRTHKVQISFLLFQNLIACRGKKKTPAAFTANVTLSIFPSYSVIAPSFCLLARVLRTIRDVNRPDTGQDSFFSVSAGQRLVWSVLEEAIAPVFEGWNTYRWSAETK